MEKWLSSYFTGKKTGAKIRFFNHNRLNFHCYPLADLGVIVLERANSPLPDELVNALVTVFDRLKKGCQAALEHERIVLEIDRRRIAEKHIEHLAYHDDLTGLPNRRDFLSKIDIINKQSSPRSKYSVLFYIGLDNFKDINHSLGYQFGDKVLKKIANRLSNQLQPSNLSLSSCQPATITRSSYLYLTSLT